MLSGDYNRDGTVDAADYVVWRKTLNQTLEPGSGADGTGPGGEPDGLVTSLDYDLWRSQFGVTPSPAGSGMEGVAVPEPTAWAVALGAVPAIRRGRRSSRECG
jgi:hypothetical protein